MCPACLAAAAAFALKAASVGGVAAYAATKLRTPPKALPIEPSQGDRA